MSFFSAAKSKLEEIVGKVERTIGGAVGDKAMEFGGEALEEHGESMHEQHADRDELAKHRVTHPSNEQTLRSDEEIGAARDKQKADAEAGRTEQARDAETEALETQPVLSPDGTDRAKQGE